jgi:hypothetical protein
MDFMFDPAFRATGIPLWDRRIEVELPSRQRLIALRSEYAAQQRLTAASRVPWPRRAMLRVGDVLVATGERLREGHGPHPRPLSQ